MKHKPLYIYLGLVFTFSLGFVFLMKTMGEKGNYLAGIYMLIPALSAIITRIFFYEKRFSDARINPGLLKHYVFFWLIALGISVISYLIFYSLGAITIDLSGKSFLEQLTLQFEKTGTDIRTTLPEGLTPETMLFIFFLGGLTIFNIFPGIITGLGEEFGWRGFMFPLLYKIHPLWGFIGGGLAWFLWHIPLAFVIPQTNDYTFLETAGSFIILAIGSICTFTFLSYVFVKSGNIFVVSLAHITLNNSARSFSYYVILENQIMANAGLTLTMALVIFILYKSGQFKVFKEYFNNL